MGYFSNGAEGMSYEARYCDHCHHQNGPDGESGCDVWLAHNLHNYTECNNKESILHLLIPRTEDGLGNEQCRMFMEKTITPQSMTAADVEYLLQRAGRV